jgi:8-oxo-dGTP pyrophosphatase MutT (NUDIX family)
MERARFCACVFPQSSAVVPRLSSTILVLARAPAAAAAASPSTSQNLFKILFVQRSRSSGFMASAHVFPGGVLDKADENTDAWTTGVPRAAAAAALSSSPSYPSLNPAGRFPLRQDKGDLMALRICAVRVLFEETGLLLARPASTAASASPAVAEDVLLSSAHSFPSLEAQQASQKASSSNAGSLASMLARERLQLEPLKLVPWSRWITPVFEKRRYDTMFYLAALSAPYASLSADPREVSSMLWLSPREALDMASRRAIVLPPPTTYILREIEHARTVEEVMQHAPRRNITPLLPRLLPQEALPHTIADAESSAQAVPANRAAAAAAAAVLHMSLPGDVCYPGEDGLLPAACQVLSSRPLTEQQQLWHRMLRSTDPKETETAIFRPQEMHLPLADAPPQLAKL